jgi:hypothetical protein
VALLTFVVWYVVREALIIQHRLIKVKLFLFLSNSALCHEGVGGDRSIVAEFLTSTLDGGEWSASRSC